MCVFNSGGSSRSHSIENNKNVERERENGEGGGGGSGGGSEDPGVTKMSLTCTGRLRIRQISMSGSKKILIFAYVRSLYEWKLQQIVHVRVCRRVRAHVCVYVCVCARAQAQFLRSHVWM